MCLVPAVYERKGTREVTCGYVRMSGASPVFEDDTYGQGVVLAVSKVSTGVLDSVTPGL